MTALPSRHDWVLAAPFRAQLQHLHATSGLAWDMLAHAAGVSPTLVRHLVFGNQGRYPRRISPLTAKRLLRLTPARLRKLTARLPEVPAAVA